MSYSLIKVQTSRQAVNILAETTNSQNAIDRAIAAANGLGQLSSASEVGGSPISLVISAAASPSTNDAPKAVFRVEFRLQSGPNGTTPSPINVLAWPQTTGGIQTAAATLARQAAETNATATASAILALATVDIDATGNAPVTLSPLSKVEFLGLFTQAELALVFGAQTSALTQEQKAVVATIIVTFQVADNIALDDPTTIGGVGKLVEYGIITSQRATQILAGHAPA